MFGWHRVRSVKTRIGGGSAMLSSTVIHGLELAVLRPQ
jgi:hypothetical protein